MSNFIKRHRIKNRNGVEIVLFEKTVDIKVELEELSSEISYTALTESLSAVQKIIDDLKIKSENYLPYDFETIDSKFSEIASTFTNQNETFEIKDFHTREIQLPFAVRNSVESSWGGQGKAGIFWTDPSAEAPVGDYQSIKVGRDDADIGESGYTFSDVTSSMRFMMQHAPGRGFTWSSWSGQPIMSLSSWSDILTLAGSIYFAYTTEPDAGSPTEHTDSHARYIAPIHYSGFYPTLVYSGTSELLPFMSIGNYVSEANGYALVYRPAAGGLAKLVFEEVSGSGGGSVSGLDADHVSGSSLAERTFGVGDGGTGGDNFWFPDNIHINGSSIFFGSSPASENISHTAGWISASTAVYVTGLLKSSSDIIASNHIFVNNSNYAGTEALPHGRIYFYNAGVYGASLYFNTGDTEFNITHQAHFDGDVLSNRDTGSYTDTGTTVTGTTILSAGTWDFEPSDITTENYSWNFIDSASTQWRSGIKDHTVVWNDNTNEYHIIGIRTVASGLSVADKHPELYGSTFLHAKTKNFSAGTYEEVGILDALGGTNSENKYFDGHIISNIWAPHIVEYDGAFYMFYAGVEFSASDGYQTGPNAIQRVFCAKSYDLEDWSSPEIKYLMDGTESVWAATSTVSCRDPFVIRDDDNDRWTMFLTVEVGSAYADIGADVEVVGIATATTLMGDWTLIDWVRDSERPYTPYSGQGESPYVILGTDDNYYLSWSCKVVGIWTHATAFASASTISTDGTDWTLIPAMSGMGPATSITKSPYQDNLWIATTINPYTQWAVMTADNALTFTGVSDTLTYTGHSAMSIGYSSTSLTQRFNLTDTLIGHINEHNIHLNPAELYLPASHISGNSSQSPYQPLNFGWSGAARFGFTDHLFIDNSSNSGNNTSVYLRNTGDTKWAIDVDNITEDLQFYRLDGTGKVAFTSASQVRFIPPVQIDSTLTVTGNTTLKGLTGETSYLSGIKLESGNVYISYTGNTLRPRLYFHDGSTPTGEFLGYDTGTSVFTLTAPFKSTGSITGETGLVYGTEDTDDRYFKVVDDVPASAVTSGIFGDGGTGSYSFGGNVNVSGTTVSINAAKSVVGILQFSGTQASIYHQSGGLIFKDASSDKVTFENDIDVGGIIYSGGVDIATMMGGTGGTSDHGALTGLGDDDHPRYSQSAHTHAASQITAGTFGAGAYTFPSTLYATGAMVIYSDTLYLDYNNNDTQSIIGFRGDDSSWIIAHHAQQEFRFGPATIDAAFYGEVSVGGNHLYLSNFADNGTLGDDNVTGSGIWFGSGSTSDSITYQDLNLISASTNVHVNGAISAPYDVSTFIDGTPVTGNTILSGSSWRFIPSGFSEWTFVHTDSQTYRSGIKDFTLFWDEDYNEHHIIGINTVASGYNSNGLAYYNTINFLWAKSPDLSGSSFTAAGADGRGLIDSICSREVDGEQIDMVWAPHLLKHDNAYYLFYTGIEWGAGDNGLSGPKSKQKIFVAKTYDVNDWSSPELSFCFDGDASFTTYSTVTDYTYSCRDPYVVWDEDNNRWLMTVSIQVAAASSDAGTDIMACGLASATTLMGDWTLYDWIRESEFSVVESSLFFKGPNDLWYLHYSVDDDAGSWADKFHFASATTLSDVTGYTHITALDMSAPAGHQAAEILQSPYNPNIYLMPWVDPYPNGWSQLRFDYGLEFTGAGQILSYVSSHSAVTIPYTATTWERTPINVIDQIIGHASEHEIHHSISELDNRYVQSGATVSAHTHPASAITSGTFGSGDYVFEDNVRIKDILYINTDDAAAYSTIFFHNGTTEDGASLSFDHVQQQWNISHRTNFGGGYLATDGATGGFDLYLNTNTNNTTRIWFGNSDGAYNAYGLSYDTTNNYFNFTHSLNVAGDITSGGNNISTMFVPTGGTIKASQVDGNTIQADSTFAGGTSDHYWFPAYLLVKGNEFYLDSAGAFSQSVLQFHGGSSWCIYHHATSEFRWGPAGVNTALYGDVCVGGNNLYLSNFADNGASGADDVVGSGIWFGSGSTSHNLTFQSGDIISASTDVSINGSITASTSIFSGSSDIADIFSPTGHTHEYSAITKGITVPEVTSAEDITLFFTDDAITVRQTNTVLRGTGTPSCAWWMMFATDRSAAGTRMHSATTTSTTTGDELTSFTDSTIPAGNWVWLETSATGGTTVDEFHITMEFTVD